MIKTVLLLAGAALLLAACSRPAPPETGFQITVEPSGRGFVAQGDETILSAAIRQGIGLPYGCKDGACGSCKCKKLSGEVTHGPHQSKALSAEEEVASCSPAAPPREAT